MSAAPSLVLEAMAEKRAAVERTPLHSNLGALLDEAVARHADRLLWVPVEGGEPMTYAAFGVAVERCVSALHGLGVRRGTHVAVMLPSVPALAVTWMALAKLGAVMLPVNTRYTAWELRHLLREGDAALLVADASHRPVIEQDGGTTPLPQERILLLGAEAAGYAGEWQGLLDAAGAAPPPSPPDTDQLMTLQFTSGSTGAPKGCMLTHRYWLTIALARVSQGPPVRRMLIDMPFHYMGGQWRFLMALHFGATVFVAPQPSLTRMLERLLAYDIEFCSVTPALAKQPPHPRRASLCLRWAGTMALPKDLHVSLQAQLGGAPVREMYGLTETGSAIAMPYEVDWMTGSGSCGLAAPFRTLRIMGENGQEVSHGDTGELWISGPGMMQGYYKRDDANAEAFRDGWFRSGDLFRQDANGFLSIIGRIKDVIRRSGENISANELEGVLSTMPEIVEVAAIAVPDEARGEEVKVCLTLRPGLTSREVTPERVMAHAREHLARFKLPRYIAYLPELPKTPSGKVAKQSLRPPGADLRLGAYDALDGLWR
jgi:crotonobetaine/carnitine-CoA ligase